MGDGGFRDKFLSYSINHYYFKAQNLDVYARVSNSSRNSSTSNIEYLAIKYSNSSSISNSTNTPKNRLKSAYFYHFFFSQKMFKNNSWKQCIFVEIMCFWKIREINLYTYYLCSIPPHFAEMYSNPFLAKMAKITWDQHFVV